MEISRYASRLAPESRVLPSGRPLQASRSERGSADKAPQRGPLDGKADATTDPNSSGTFSLASRQSLPEEPDDAKLTGGTRSLSRRLLALNIPGLSAPQIQAASAALGGPSRKPKARKAALTRNAFLPHDA